MNKIIEKAFLDILITIVILVSLVAWSLPIRWFLIFYTPVILAARVVALANKKVTSSRGVPDWFFHMLYAINVAVMIYHHWLVLGAMWLMIWILAVVFIQRRRKISQSPRRKKRR